MIFVTVGTHEQQFDRLIKCVDELKRENTITEEVVIQSGYCTYEPQYCEWSKMFPYLKMAELIDKARIVITHGGPSSIMPVLQVAKIPIVVPRQKKYDEHVNDHQLEFAHFIQKRQGNIIVVEEIDDLQGKVEQYDIITQTLTGDMKSHNQIFNQELEKIVQGLFVR